MIWAVFRRNFLAYFINPTGYVFITVFILLGAIAAFWQPGFFLNNLANLDQLSAFFPLLLLFFVPALTMAVWAEERKQGTDELLFTLPGRDVDIVLGKYLAVLGIYTVAILFSLSHVFILAWLGDPDLGLIASTYLGYWLSGAALLSVGMVASLLTSNITVAFILGAIFCGVFVFIDNVENLFGGQLSQLIGKLGITPHFEPFGDGVISFTSVFYMLALTGIMLYLNVALLGHRHHAGGQGSMPYLAHRLVRAAALVAIGVALGVLLDRTAWYADATAENLHTLQPQTKELIEAIPGDQPVFIQAFISPEVPESYVRVRKNLLNILRRLNDIGGDHIRLAVYETEPYTERATEAAENYGITARQVMAVEASQRSTAEIFLGLVFTSGAEEFVIPFFDRGLPVEYELARSVRVVSQSQRKKLGIVATQAKVFGGFDFQTMTNSPDWSFVAELRKQYEVEQVPPGGPYPEDLDALLVVMPSSMSQPELGALREAIEGGMPTLLFDDPLPMFDPQLSASLPSEASQNPFTSQGQPPPVPKGNFDALLASMGLSWRNTSIIWSGYNPHPTIADVDPEILFIAEGPDEGQPFNPESPIVAGLQEVVLLYPGFVRGDIDVPGADLQRTPLMKTGPVSGYTEWNSLLTRGFLGLQRNPNPRRLDTPDSYIVGMRVTGRVPSSGAAVGPQPERDSEQGATGQTSNSIDVIFIPDVDVISETFFTLRRQGFEAFNFDNVTLALNAIDVLAGDESFVALRKHRPKHRSLTTVEALSKDFRDQQIEQRQAAEAKAAEQLAEAQENLNEKVAELRERTDLDDQTKTIMLRNLERVENRRLDVIEANIEQEKQQSLARARAEMEAGVASIQRDIKWLAALLPPIPTLALAVAFLAYRYRRERVGISERRLAA